MPKTCLALYGPMKRLKNNLRKIMIASSWVRGHMAHGQDHHGQNSAAMILAAISINSIKMRSKQNFLIFILKTKEALMPRKQLFLKRDPTNGKNMFNGLRQTP